MRYGCNQRLRNAFYHWALTNLQNDDRSKEHYAQLRHAGHGHARALRGIADRLLAMLVAMLKTATIQYGVLHQSARPKHNRNMPRKPYERSSAHLARFTVALNASWDLTNGGESTFRDYAYQRYRCRFECAAINELLGKRQQRMPSGSSKDRRFSHLCRPPGKGTSMRHAPSHRFRPSAKNHRSRAHSAANA
jgi:hypothetical protein